MKKTIIAIAAVMFLASCGGSNSESINATYADTVGPDSSQILPALIDSTKADTLKVDTLSVKPVE
jgi:hypothetical protein